MTKLRKHLDIIIQLLGGFIILKAFAIYFLKLERSNDTNYVGMLLVVGLFLVLAPHLLKTFKRG